MARTFPNGFLWGTATGAHQTEGNNLASDWWARENAAESSVEVRSGDGVDFYHRWREDMDLAAGAGFTDFRFGIEWSRIEPVEGHISTAEVQHYRRMVQGAVQRGLRPIVTLHHFTLPLWFAQRGGWLQSDSADRFTRYIAALAPVLSAGVTHVETINEPNIVAVFPKLQSEAGSSLANGLPVPDPLTTTAIIAAHHAARRHLRDRHPELLIGWGISVQDYQPEPGAESVFHAYVHPRDEIFMEASNGDDWIGVQTYTRGRIGVIGGEPVPIVEAADVERTQTGWEYYPKALGGAVRRVASVVGRLPIIVTENGIATADDQRRIDYTSASLASLQEAMDAGIDVRGYLHWSLLDNWEWGSYRPTFGLVAVDRTTFERTPRPSLRWLGAQAPRPALDS